MIRFFLCICKSVMENHYNLLYREDERELIPICKQMNVSLMPYSPLAAGHLARPTWKSESLEEERTEFAVVHDRMEDADMKIVTRVYELAEKYQCRCCRSQSHGSGQCYFADHRCNEDAVSG